MIPKIIHYAWFGSKIPKVVEDRVDDWKKILPDWKFICWNEDNYDIHKFDFSGKMYDQKKYGYIVDELRYDVLYQYGGFYLDTDMVIKKSLDCFLDKKMIWGFMYDNSISGGMIGSEPKQQFLKYLLNSYSGEINKDIQNYLYKYTSNPIITELFLRKFSDLKLNNTKQELEDGIYLYPKDYFTYMSKNKNANYAEHLFANSWGTKNSGIYGFSKKVYKTMFPYKFAEISAKRGKAKSALELKQIEENK